MNLIEKFNEYTKEWKTELNKDHDYMVKFSKLVLKDLTSKEAFELIPEVVDLVLLQDDEEDFLISETLDLLLSIIRITNTTEMHEYLKLEFEELEAFIASKSDYVKRTFAEIKRWYRIKS